MPTVREMIAHIQADMRRGALEPDSAREYLIQLTALYGNCLQECIAADMAYNAVLLEHLEGVEAANRATIKAQTSPEYLRVREAKAYEKLVLAMSQALKKYLASQQEELRLAR